MGYSIDAITADCYEGTTCLINKFGIKDDKQLSLIEAGYDIDFSKINTDNLMSATIHAANGIDDFLIEIFKNSISK